MKKIVGGDGSVLNVIIVIRRRSMKGYFKSIPARCKLLLHSLGGLLLVLLGVIISIKRCIFSPTSELSKMLKNGEIYAEHLKRASEEVK